ncbi:MAG: hypothetical protein HC799_16830 [Limnothrix sp. RL_2_0]|nr:hypothetical protein [Limnothrix sp. RL_2_0]
MKIVDCFIFYNELKMLEFRLTELYDFVDFFVLVEATKTHQGDNKPLFFEENKHLYQKFSDKIIHVIVDDMPSGDDAWVREHYQRDQIISGLEQINLSDNDTILTGDADEIPDTNILSYCRENALDKIFSLEQDLYYYSLNFRGQMKWLAAKILPYKEMTKGTPTQIRMAHAIPLVAGENFRHSISRGGWHFSYFGDSDFIVNKTKSFAHKEFNLPHYLDQKKIEESILRGEDVYGRKEPMTTFSKIALDDNDYLPKHYEILANINRD